MIMKLLLSLLALLCASCASHPPRQAPGASTASVRQSLANVRGNVTAAQGSTKRAQGNVESARSISSRVDAKAQVILDNLP